MRPMPVHIALLRQHHLFKEFSEQDFSRLLDKSEIISIEKGETLFSQSQPADKFFFLIDGAIKLFRLTPDGSEKVLELVRSGQSFAEAVMFLKQPNFPVTAQAIEPAQLFVFDSQRYIELIEENSRLSLALLGQISIRLRKRIQEIETLSLNNATHRVVRFLIGQMEELDSMRVDLGMPKKMVASRLSIQPETFSRVIRKMEQAGIMEVNGRELNILDRTALLNFD
ncbi:Crp/Fnr family transcriptional regulator [Pelagibaculum spongiae]|uniref:Transcription factor n=1 Tax=Pelagibaculum spongiae TaxID=2080658 RepID=A0A2V1GWE7_9GAMM|nr:Crp/Fnr family transcriptional regulator [Pelagibaculum spongiae]PVZ68987.1 transcription factor [Pelagibaculum spongiae]